MVYTGHPKHPRLSSFHAATGTNTFTSLLPGLANTVLNLTPIAHGLGTLHVSYNWFVCLFLLWACLAHFSSGLEVFLKILKSRVPGHSCIVTLDRDSSTGTGRGERTPSWWVGPQRIPRMGEQMWGMGTYLHEGKLLLAGVIVACGPLILLRRAGTVLVAELVCGMHQLPRVLEGGESDTPRRLSADPWINTRDGPTQWSQQRGT